MTLEPSSFQTLSRVERVMNAIKERLASRALAAGAKLPSIRRFAASQQVSKSTVVEAYERLVAEGIIQSRPGSGFYVTHHLPPLALAELGPKLDREVDPFWISRQSLEAKDDFLKPGCGWLPASWMPQEEVRRALRFLARAQPSSLADYGTPLGFAPLRQLLANRLERYHIEASANQILLTESGTQAIDFLCRFLLEPGDVVLVDDPCYFNFNALLRVHRVKVVSVAYTPHGPDLAAFETALKTHNPRLYITNSAFHNPTGATLSPAVAHRLLKLAEASNLIIIEDDIFADFEHQPSPRLAAFDHFERVIYIGSFTKTISAAARCGFIVARADWIDGLIDLKIATSFGGGALNGELIFHVLKHGSYRKYLDGLHARLMQAQRQVQSELKTLDIVPWIEPQGGLFLWCVLPNGLDSAKIAQRALLHNVVLAPGNAFSNSGSAGRYMRFNVAQSGSARIYSVLRDALRE